MFSPNLSLRTLLLNIFDAASSLTYFSTFSVFSLISTFYCFSTVFVCLLLFIFYFLWDLIIILQDLFPAFPSLSSKQESLIFLFSTLFWKGFLKS